MKRNATTGIAFLLVTLLALFGCTKDFENVGLDLQPDDNLIGINYDTSIFITVYSEIAPPLPSCDYDVMRIGAMWDPIFGKQSVDLFTQLSLEEVSPEFDTLNIVTDSVIFRLRMGDSYADTNANITLQVRAIDGASSGAGSGYLDYFTKDSVQYSDWFLPVEDAILGELTFNPSEVANDTGYVVIDSVAYPALIQIPLDPSFADIIFYAPDVALGSQEYFDDYFKGINISAVMPSSPDNGTITTFTPVSTYTEIIIYYREGTDTLTYSLDISSDDAYFGYYNHYDYLDAAPELKAQIVNNDTAQGAEYAYLQGMTGVRTRVIIPDLTGLYGKVINEAVLQIVDANPDEEEFLPPSQFYLYEEYIDDENDTVMAALSETGSSTYFDGLYDSDTHMARMRISQYVQSLILGENDADRELFLAAAFESSRPGRLQFYGRDPEGVSTKRIQLQLVFTDIE